MLKDFASYITYGLMHLERGSQLGDAIEFFIYDTIKIFLLLAIIIFVVSFIRSFFRLRRQKKFFRIKKSL